MSKVKAYAVKAAAAFKVLYANRKAEAALVLAAVAFVKQALGR